MHQLKCKSDVRIGIDVWQRGRQVKKSRHALLAPRKDPALANISNELLNGRDDRNGKYNTEKAGKLCTHNECENDKERGYSDNSRNHQRVNEMVFELLDDDEHGNDEQTERQPTVDEGEHYRGNRGEDRPVHRDYLEYCCNNSEEKR